MLPTLTGTFSTGIASLDSAIVPRPRCDCAICCPGLLCTIVVGKASLDVASVPLGTTSGLSKFRRSIVVPPRPPLIESRCAGARCWASSRPPSEEVRLPNSDRGGVTESPRTLSVTQRPIDAIRLGRASAAAAGFVSGVEG